MTRLHLTALAAIAAAMLAVAAPARAAAPANDDWDQATVVSAVPFTTTEDTRDATTASDDDSFFFSKTVWFSFTPGVDERVAFSTQGSDYDTDTLVYTGSRAARVAMSTCDYPGYGILWCNVAAGTTYHVMVSARYRVGGQLVFSVVFPPSISFAVDPSATLLAEPRVVRVTGTIACSVPMTVVSEVWFLQANASSVADRALTCSPPQASWQVDVPDYGYFAPGPGTVLVSGSGTGLGGPAYASASSAARLVVPDRTPPVIAVPAAITVDATGPSGASVAYSVSAHDDVDPAPSVACSPASGSTFPIGSTTVSCTALDSAGNLASASFTVTVEGAAAQLADLAAAAAGRGPGTSLADKVAQAAALLAAGDPSGAREALVAFENQVSAQVGKTLTAADAAALGSASARIRAVVGP